MFFFSANQQSFWLDEATTAKVVYKFSFFEIIPRFSTADFHPPLYYLIIDLWQNVFPFNEFFIRLPSIIFILISFFILVFYLKSIWAGIFFIFNPLVVYYAVEARMYALVVLLFSVSFALFIKNRINFVFFLSLFLSILSFYGSVFFVLAYLLYFLLKGQKRRFIQTFTVLILSLLVLFPLFSKQIEYSSQILSAVPNWSAVLGKANIKNLILVFVKTVLGRVRFEQNFYYYFSAFLGMVLVYIPLLFLPKTEKIRRVFFMLLIPVLLGFFFSFYKPVLQYFRFLYIAVVLAVGLSYIESFGYKVFLFVFFAVLSFFTVFDKSFYREDWKGAVFDIKQNSRVYMIKEVSDPLWFYDLKYNRKIKLEDIRSLDVQNPEKAVVIQYAASIFGVDFLSIMKDYKILDQRFYRGNIIVYEISL